MLRTTFSSIKTQWYKLVVWSPDVLGRWSCTTGLSTLTFFPLISQFATHSPMSFPCSFFFMWIPNSSSKNKSMNNGQNGWSCGGVSLVFQYWLNYQLGTPSEAQRHEIAWHFFSLCTLPLAISSATFHREEDSKRLRKSFWSNSWIYQKVGSVKVDR